MTRVQRSALMPYSCHQMFQVINDVEAYPGFLPWCSGSKLLESSPTHMLARLEMRAPTGSHGFTTRNRLEYPNRIHLDLVEGPFTNLKGVWHLDALGTDGCKVSLDMTFSFDSKMLKMAFAGVFSMAADKMVDAFCSRAESLYR